MEFIVTLLLCWMVFWNVLAFILYGIDKNRAKHNRWRIPEKVLLGVAFVSGGFGALLGMRVFHHKTKHMQFVIGVPLACVIWIVIFGYCLLKVV